MDEFGRVLYKDKVMIEVEPYERCKFKIGLLLDGKVRFFKFAPRTVPAISFSDVKGAFEPSINDVLPSVGDILYKELSEE